MSPKLFLTTILLSMALQGRLIPAELLKCQDNMNEICDGYCGVEFRKKGFNLSFSGCFPNTPTCAFYSEHFIFCTCDGRMCHKSNITYLKEMAIKVFTENKEIPTTVCNTTSGQQFCSFPGQFCTAKFQLTYDKTSVTDPDIICTNKEYSDHCREENRNAYCNCKNETKCIESDDIITEMKRNALKALEKLIPSTSTTSSTTTTTTTTTTAESTSYAKMTQTTIQTESSLSLESPQKSDVTPVENNSDTVKWIGITVIASVAFISATAIMICKMRIQQKRTQQVAKPAASKRPPLAEETKVEATQGTDDGRQTTSFSQIIGDTTTHDTFT